MEKAASLGHEVKHGGGWLVALGIAMIVTGVLSIAAPLQTGIAVALVVGALMALTGLLEIGGAFRAASFDLGLGDFLGGLLYLGVGVLVLLHPLMGLGFLSILLAAFFFVRGVYAITLAWRLKPRSPWGWVLLGGALSVAFGLFLLLGWPLTGAWAVGVFVGIELLFSGWTMVFFGGTLRDAGRRLEAQAG